MELKSVASVNGSLVEVVKDPNRVVRFFDSLGVVISKSVYRDWRGRLFVQDSQGAFECISRADERLCLDRAVVERAQARRAARHPKRKIA